MADITDSDVAEIQTLAKFVSAQSSDVVCRSAFALVGNQTFFLTFIPTEC